MDLLEQTRRDDVYDRMSKVLEGVENLGVFPSLVWIWAWDNVKSKIDSYHPDSGEYYVINPKYTEKDIWDLFWDQADRNGFTLEYGIENLDDMVFDWMTDNDILIEYGLDEEGADVVESDKGE